MTELDKHNNENNLLASQVAQIIREARQTAYRAVNFTMVLAYWNIGKLIVEDELHWERADYGKAVLRNLSQRLTKEFGKGFDESNLRYMRLFYKTFPICDTLRHELSWSHYRRLISVENSEARMWYMNEAADSVWSTRQLDRQISTLYYDRLLASQNKQVVIQEAEEKLKAVAPEDFIKDPYVLEFLNLKDYPDLRESDVEKGLITNLQDFLLELGKGFCFVARQKRMRYDDEDFYVDLVFYNSILKCYVLIDLKLGKLTHQDVGQMDSYIRMFDDLMKQPDDNPTIGLILCSEKNEAVARYSVLNDAKQMFASKYKLTLPTEEELQAELTEARRILEK
jgi:predicted nuclease of restriction endonuclease-like (RecB) superfamily